ncbi:neutral cholesterol ester hydrolase 1-like [Branchiostoma lanceolatum]|uniref:neutral cholesterol ester hydrolase 1-like n=1 Tax=Branchiostoma lanceolatum TaxID=7740 RepID=UPI0034512709
MGVLGTVTWLTAASALGAAVFAAYVNSSLPPDVAEPRKVFIFKGLERIRHFIAWIYEEMGFGIMRSLPLQRVSHPDLKVTDASFDGVRVRVYQPKAQKTAKGGKMAGLLWFHGGGWIIGSIDSCDALVGRIANQTGAAVVSVEYRLAPEHKFPIPFEDCLTATQHFLQHASEYGVDSTRIGVAGDSAGGNLAAAVALRLNKDDKKKFPPLKLQALVYPSLQTFDFQTPSYVRGRSFFVTLPSEVTIGLWLRYLNNNMSLVDTFSNNGHTAALKNSRFASYVDRHFLDESVPRSTPDEDVSIDLPDDIKDILNPYFSPLMAEDADLSGLPNTYVTVCGKDVLRDDGIMYAKRLEMAGVQVQLVRYPSGFHGILTFASEPFYFKVGKQMEQDLTTFLRDHL